MPTNLLDLPVDITSQIFSHFERAVDLHQPGRIPLQWNGLTTIQACRLTCRSLNEIASGLLCPLFRGRLDKATMQRIDSLSQNPMIASGIRGIEISLSFRPKPIAADLGQYCKFVTEKVDDFRGSCHFHTEFKNYEEDDESPDAVEWRALMEAQSRLFRIRDSWRKVVEPERETHEAPDAEYQQLLRDCFAAYALRQREEEEIVNDGSFVREVAAAMARCKHAAWLSFGDVSEARPRDAAMKVAYDKELLAKEMLLPHYWLAVEDKVGGADLLPARLLVKLPIACARLGAPLRGLDVGCFPLKTMFSSLIPTAENHSPAWTELSSACRQLKTFQFGRRGMNCTPYRQQRISPEDCAIVDGYLSAVCSSLELATVYISMCPFRKRGTQVYRGPVSPDLLHRGSTILRALDSASLTSLELNNVEIPASDLEPLLRRLPRYRMNKIRLTGIQLSSGGFAGAMDILRSIKGDSKGCEIDMCTLEGGEFGDPKGFKDDNSWMFGGEDSKAFFGRLREHMNPPLLQLASAYINGKSEVNPLLKMEGQMTAR